MWEETRLLGSEVGGVGCYVDHGSMSVVTGIVPTRDGLLSGDHFKVFPSSINRASRFLCSNRGKPILFHTHPNGVEGLSGADIAFSKRADVVICSVAGSEIRCADGDRRINV